MAALGLPRACSRTSSTRARRSARCCREVARADRRARPRAHRGRLARHRLGRRRRADAGDDAAYISCGTWGLVGVELDVAGAHRREPRRQLHQRGRRRRPHPLPHERHGDVAALRDACATWERAGDQRVDSTRPARRGRRRHRPRCRSSTCRTRGSCRPATCRRASRRCATSTASPAPASRAEHVRSIVESLAHGFARARRPGRRALVRPARSGVVHVVGGGSLNRLLCQAIADRSGRPCSPARSRRPRSATCSSRPVRSAPSPARWRTCGARRAHPRPRALRAESMID